MGLGDNFPMMIGVEDAFRNSFAGCQSLFEKCLFRCVSHFNCIIFSLELFMLLINSSYLSLSGVWF